MPVNIHDRLTYSESFLEPYYGIKAISVLTNQSQFHKPNLQNFIFLALQTNQTILNTLYNQSMAESRISNIIVTPTSSLFQFNRTVQLSIKLSGSLNFTT